MAERKGIDHKMVWILPGLHAVMIHARGFLGSTVPAMKMGRKRYQHSREISRALEDAAPEPRLFPETPRDRLEVEEAERWGEEILQEAPRRIYRWVASNSAEFRVQLAGEVGIARSVAGRTAHHPGRQGDGRPIGVDGRARAGDAGIAARAS